MWICAWWAHLILAYREPHGLPWHVPRAFARFLCLKSESRSHRQRNATPCIHREVSKQRDCLLTWSHRFKNIDRRCCRHACQTSEGSIILHPYIYISIYIYIYTCVCLCMCVTVLISANTWRAYYRMHIILSFNARHTKSQNWNVSRLVLQSPLSNPLKPGVKSRMKM